MVVALRLWCLGVLEIIRIGIGVVLNVPVSRRVLRMSRGFFGDLVGEGEGEGKA